MKFLNLKTLEINKLYNFLLDNIIKCTIIEFEYLSYKYEIPTYLFQCLINIIFNIQQYRYITNYLIIL